MSKTPPKLNVKQLAFVSEYMVDMNATQAAIRAGYSPRSAAEQASKLLINPKIQEEVARRRKHREVRTSVSSDRVILEAARLALFDPRKLFHEDGSPKAVTELDDDTAACIGGLDVVHIGNSELGVGQVLKYKINDKNSALEKLFKHHGLYERDNAQKTDPMTEFLKWLGERTESGSRLPIARE